MYIIYSFPGPAYIDWSNKMDPKYFYVTPDLLAGQPDLCNRVIDNKATLRQSLNAIYQVGKPLERAIFVRVQTANRYSLFLAFLWDQAMNCRKTNSSVPNCEAT